MKKMMGFSSFLVIYGILFVATSAKKFVNSFTGNDYGI